MLVYQLTAHHPAALLRTAPTEDRICHHHTPEIPGHIDDSLTSNKADHGGLENVEQPTPDPGMTGMARAFRMPSYFVAARAFSLSHNCFDLCQARSLRPGDFSISSLVAWPGSGIVSFSKLVETYVYLWLHFSLGL
jgi:hypothetical protein